MNSLVENQIKKFIGDRTIVSRTLLSKAFNIKCEKIILSTKEIVVVKYYEIINNDFNSIDSEINSLN